MLSRVAVNTVLWILALSALSACGKPKYVIPGLSLPPGSTVIKQHYRGRLKDGGINLTFNCPGGWDYVYQYIDKCLLEAGFSEVTENSTKTRNDSEEGLEELNPVMKDPDNPDIITLEEDYNKYTRAFRKPGYYVTLQLTRVYGNLDYDKGAKDADKKRIQGWGEYCLFIADWSQGMKSSSSRTP
jgi:hypothetical protein